MSAQQIHSYSRSCRTAFRPHEQDDGCEREHSPAHQLLLRLDVLEDVVAWLEADGSSFWNRSSLVS